MSRTVQPTMERPVSKERLRLWLRLLKSTRVVENQVRERLREHYGTTLPRFDVMATLCRFEEGLKMSELSDLLRVSNGNVTGIVERLVNDGMVRRSPVENDRRAMRVRLTPAGRAAFARLAADHESWIDELLGDVTGEDAADLTRRLRDITRELEGKT